MEIYTLIVQSFAQRKAKMHDYKNYAPVTTWPQGQFISQDANFTCHHEVKLTRVNSFNNISFINKLRNIKSIQTK